MKFTVIQGCPCPAEIAPVFETLVRETGAHVNSIYRGEDAAAILHRNHHQTQAEIYATYPPGVANPPGRSTHELFSDGVAYNVPQGHRLPAWCQGIDVNDGDVPAMIAAAKRHGWDLFQPYHAGVEFHHLNFRHEPKVKAAVKARHIVHRRQSAQPMIPQQAIDLIKSFEGFSSTIYNDGTGVMTVGYGTTESDIRPLPNHVTQQQAEALMRRKLMEKYLPPIEALHVKLNANQLSAVLSFVYNLGVGTLEPGYDFGRALRSGDLRGAADRMLEYDHAGSQRLAGLTRRRIAERQLFLRPVATPKARRHAPAVLAAVAVAAGSTAGVHHAPRRHVAPVSPPAVIAAPPASAPPVTVPTPRGLHVGSSTHLHRLIFERQAKTQRLKLVNREIAVLRARGVR